MASSLIYTTVWPVVQGKIADVALLHERSLAIKEKTLGPEHPDVASLLNSLALSLESQVTAAVLLRKYGCF